MNSIKEVILKLVVLWKNLCASCSLFFHTSTIFLLQRRPCKVLFVSIQFARTISVCTYHISLHVPYHTIPYHTIPYHTIPYHTIPYHTIPYHTIPYHTIPYHTIPHHTIPYLTSSNKSHVLCGGPRSVIN